MGFLSNLLGGKKAPPPPTQLRETAESVHGLAKGQEGRVGDLRDAINPFLRDVLPGYIDNIAGDFGNARDSALALSGDYGAQWDDYGRPIMQQTGAEVLAAGSAGRQEEEARRAREMTLGGVNASLTGYRDSLRRRGVFGNAGNSPHLSVLTGAQIGAAGNEARLRERMSGEALRRAFLPQAQQWGDREMMYDETAAGYGQNALQAEALAPGMATDFYNAETGLASNVGGLFSNAQQMFGHSYNADMTKINADNARRQRIFGNVVKLGTMAAGAFGAGAAGMGGGVGAMAGASPEMLAMAPGNMGATQGFNWGAAGRHLGGYGMPQQAG